LLLVLPAMFFLPVTRTDAMPNSAEPERSGR